MPTGTITSVKMAIAIYCLKRSIFNSYDAGASVSFTDPTPGAWLVPQKDTGGLAVINDGEDPGEFAALFTAAGYERSNQVFTFNAHRNLFAADLIDFFNTAFRAGTIPDGVGENTHWGTHTIGITEYVTPLSGNTSPLRVRMWAIIEYEIDGKTETYTATTEEEFMLNAMNDYDINSTLSLSALPMDGVLYNYGAHGSPAAVLGSSYISGMVFKMRIWRHAESEINNLISGIRDRWIMPAYMWWMDGDLSPRVDLIPTGATTVITPTQKTGYSDGTVSFSLGGTLVSSQRAKYYPHVHTEILIEVGRPGAQIELPFMFNGAVVAPEYVAPALWCQELSSIGQSGGLVYGAITKQVGSHIEYDNDIPVVTVPKSTSMFYFTPTEQKTFPLKIISAGLDIEIETGTLRAYVPAMAEHYRYYEHEGVRAWRPFTGGNSGDINLRIAFPAVPNTTVPASAGEISIQLVINVPLDLTTDVDDIETIFGDAVWPITDPIAMYVEYYFRYKVGTGDFVILRQPGWLYLNMSNLVTLEYVNHTPSPSNWRQVNNIRVKTTKIVASQDHFTGAHDIDGDSGYYMGSTEGQKKMKAVSEEGGIATYTRTNTNWEPVLGNANIPAHDKLIETYDFDAGNYLNYASANPGTKNVDIRIPEDLPTDIPGSVYSVSRWIVIYLMGDSNEVSIEMLNPTNLDDNVSMRTEVTAPV